MINYTMLDTTLANTDCLSFSSTNSLCVVLLYYITVLYSNTKHWIIPTKSTNSTYIFV